MRGCWTEHDSCAANCPCNEECIEGCSDPREGHPCDSWFCQGYVMTCAAENDSNREMCEHGDQNNCEINGCCWTPFDNNNHDGPDVPWCHKPKKQLINP